MNERPMADRPRSAASRVALLVLMLAVTVGLAWSLLSLPPEAPGLGPRVHSNLRDSGVENPVTAVLLNFRGYDTLLEVGVLMLAALGVLSLAGDRSAPARHTAGPILLALVRVLLPMSLLVAGYLLWTGAHAPGGAFQAGAVLGAAGVLLVVTDVPLPRVPVRPAVALGLTVFLAVSIGVMAVSGRLLEYPRDWASGLILLVEAAATVSIAITLTVLFVGGSPAGAQGWRGSREGQRKGAP